MDMTVPIPLMEQNIGQAIRVDESRSGAGHCFLGHRDRDRVWKSAMFAILNGRGEMAERLKAAVC